MAQLKFVLRNGTDAEWGASNRVLLKGEPGFASTSKTLKFGDGVNTWGNLTSISGGTGGGGTTYSVFTNNTNGLVPQPVTSDTTRFLRDDGTWAVPAGSGGGGGSGSVTSVGLSLPDMFTVTNSPVTSSGLLTGTLATQALKTVLMGPVSGAPATPTFRTLQLTDLPTDTRLNVYTGSTPGIVPASSDATSILTGAGWDPGYLNIPQAAAASAGFFGQVCVLSDGYYYAFNGFTCWINDSTGLTELSLTGSANFTSTDSSLPTITAKPLGNNDIGVLIVSAADATRTTEITPNSVETASLVIKGPSAKIFIKQNLALTTDADYLLGLPHVQSPGDGWGGTNVMVFDATGNGFWTPTVDPNHTHAWSEITSKPTTIAGFGIVDGVTTNVTTLSGLTSVGTIATGVWNATAIADNKIASALTGKTYNGNTITAGTGTLTLNSATLDIGTGGTLGSAAFTNTNAYEVPLTISTGLTRSTNTITVNSSQNIATLSNLTSNGFVKTSGLNGTLSVDTATYLTGNQTVALSGDVTGSGATAITTAIGANRVTLGMMATVATNTLLGRSTALAGNVETITVGSGLSLSGGILTASGGGGGTVTSVSVTTANGISGSVATPTVTPAITLTLGAITPTSVAASGTVTGSNLSGTNTGDQTLPTLGSLGAVATTRQIIAGTGLSGGGDLSLDRTLTVSYGATSTTACVGNDSRLSDARTPTAHTHTAANITDFLEAVDDRVGSLLVAGTFVTLNYDDTANTLTINATGGGGVPGGSNQQIQFNNSSVFDGSANLTWNGTTLAVAGTTTTTNAGINTSSFDGTNPERLKVDNGASSSVNVISGYANVNSYAQLNIKNTNAGTTASSDIIATANNGTESTNYVDLGINSSAWTSTTNVGAVLDGYVYGNSNDFWVGAAGAGRTLKFFVGGLDTTVNERASITSSGVMKINNLTGAGTRMVVSDSSGNLSTQAIPGGGSGATKAFAIAMAIVL